MLTPEDLRERRESYAVQLQSLIKDVVKYPNAAFFMMEGKDGDYYRPRIGAIMNAKEFSFHYRNFQGKDNLKNLLTSVKRNDSVNNSRILFFFDRDYEKDLNEISMTDCYVTDGYSVENNYTEISSVRSCLASIFFSDLFETKEDHDELENLCSLYRELQTLFHKSVSLFNFWAWSQRYFDKKGKVDLDKFDVKKQMRINIYDISVTSNYVLSDLNALCPSRDPIYEDEIQSASDWFNQRVAQVSFRGKQECDFLHIYISKLADLGSAGRPPFKKIRKIRKPVSKKELIADLSPYADTPISLRAFLELHARNWQLAMVQNQPPVASVMA